MAIFDTISNLYSRFTTYSKTTSFKFIFAITTSSILTTISLLTLQSIQRKTHRKALRDSIESRLDANSSKRAEGRRPDISRQTTIDDLDEELIDYSDIQAAAKAQQERRERQLQQQTRQQNGSARDSANNEERTYDEEIIREQLARNIAFLGEEAVQKIRDSFVIVVGIGGVGSAAGELQQCLESQIALLMLPSNLSLSKPLCSLDLVSAGSASSILTRSHSLL